jgi:hypothetical protein
MKILSCQQAVAERLKAVLQDPDVIQMQRDYAEAFNMVLNGEMHADHFGWIAKIYLESGTFKFHNHETGEIEEHYSAHFSDDAKQHASTSFENMKKQLELMKQMGLLKQRKTTIYDHTDGCCAQYRSASALYFMSILSCIYLVSIDRMVHAPSHGKGTVDALAAVIKRFLLECMRNVAHCAESMKQNLEHRFEAWLHKDGDENSFAAQAVRLCTNDDRKDGVTSVGNKRQKRESEKKILKRHFFRIKKLM